MEACSLDALFPFCNVACAGYLGEDTYYHPPGQPEKMVPRDTPGAVKSDTGGASKKGKNAIIIVVVV